VGRLDGLEVALEMLVGLADFLYETEFGRLVLPAARSFHLHVLAAVFL
jgi:hypothetical protein